MAIDSRRSGRTLDEGSATGAVEWRCARHDKLTLWQLYACLRLRAQVFVLEQQCLYQDLDDEDLNGDTWHLMCWEGESLRAYARLLDPERHSNRAVIGRVLTACAVRGRGLGHELMRRAMLECARLWPAHDVYLSAQAHLQSYYEHYGFQPITETYLEDGIPHVGMLAQRTPTKSFNTS